MYTGAAVITVNLPDATSIPLGATYIISSAQPTTALGYYTIIRNSVGAYITAIGSGTAAYLTLTSQANPAGTWFLSATGEKFSGCFYNGAINDTNTLPNVRYANRVYDSLAQYNTNTGVFTARATGVYTITSMLTLVAPPLDGNRVALTLFVDGGPTNYILFYQTVGGSSNNNFSLQGTISLLLNVGQTITIQYSGIYNAFITSPSFGYLSVSRA